MVQWHMKSRRKNSGGILHTANGSDKRLYWRGGEFAATEISHSDEDTEFERVKKRGNTEKQRAKSVMFASVFDKKGGKAAKAEIVSVEDNAAHDHFKRANIITKGAILRLKLGGSEKFARVTSRPGQAGSISAVIVEDYDPEAHKAARKKKKQLKAKGKTKVHKKKEEPVAEEKKEEVKEEVKKKVKEEVKEEAGVQEDAKEPEKKEAVKENNAAEENAKK